MVDPNEKISVSLLRCVTKPSICSGLGWALESAGINVNEDEELRNLEIPKSTRWQCPSCSKIFSYTKVSQMNSTVIVDKQDEYRHELHHGGVKISSP